MNPQWIALTYYLVDDEDATLVLIVENMWWKKTKNMNSRGLLVVRTKNVFLTVKKYTMWGSSGTVYVLLVPAQNECRIS